MPPPGKNRGFAFAPPPPPYTTPTRDITADHPIERAAGEDVLHALGRHPGDVDVALGQALGFGRLHALGDPSLEFFDGFTANGELDQMKRHGPSNLPVARCPIN